VKPLDPQKVALFQDLPIWPYVERFLESFENLERQYQSKSSLRLRVSGMRNQDLYGHPLNATILKSLRILQIAEMLYFGDLLLLPGEPLLLTPEEVGDSPVRRWGWPYASSADSSSGTQSPASKKPAESSPNDSDRNTEP